METLLESSIKIAILLLTCKVSNYDTRNKLIITKELSEVQAKISTYMYRVWIYLSSPCVCVQQQQPGQFKSSTSKYHFTTKFCTVEQNKDITKKCTTMKICYKTIPKYSRDTPRRCISRLNHGSSQIVAINANEKWEPCEMSVENMVFENHQTPETEMVRRHRITAAEIEFENDGRVRNVRKNRGNWKLRKIQRPPYHQLYRWGGFNALYLIIKSSYHI